jgi:uncharacterized protein
MLTSMFDRATSSPGFDRATSSPGFDRATSSPGFDRATSSPGFDRATSSPGFERVVIVPRWAGDPGSDWYPWIRAEFGRSHPNLRVDALTLPNPHAPVIDQCVAALERELGVDLAALASTLLVGHSVGCQALMRYLADQANVSQVEGAEAGVAPTLVCVAGWWTVDAPWPAIRPWLDTPIALPRLRGNASRVITLLSDDDPFTSDWRTNKSTWEQRLDADVRVSSGARHFNRAEEPAVLELLTALI